MGRQRDREQNGYVFEENGKWWVRYNEHHASGKTTRPIACLGTTEQLDTDTKVDRARKAFMAGVNESTVVTRWGTLCDSYVLHDKRFKAMTEDGQKNRGCIVRKLRNATYTGRRGEQVPFANERLDDLATAAGRTKLEDWLNDLQVTANYRHDVRGVMGQIFRYAMKQDFLKGDNPVKLIDGRNMPANTNPARVRELITPEQYEVLLNDPEMPEYCRVILMVMVCTGMRGCEALGLSWEHGTKGDPDYRPGDIDFDSLPPKIWIRRSAKGRVINKTKTLESERTAPMMAALASTLLRWKAAEPTINDWLFGSIDRRSKGRPYHPTTVRNHFKRAAARYGFGLDIGFGLHNNRHTHKAALEAVGASDQQQMRALGQTNPSTLFKYASKPDNAKELAPITEKVVTILAGKPVNSQPVSLPAIFEPVAKIK